MDNQSQAEGGGLNAARNKERKRIMKWFKEVFLPSLRERAVQYHGKTATFVTAKQSDICRRYMTSRICNGDYGQFEIYEFEFNNHKVQLCEAGKHDIIYW